MSTTQHSSRLAYRGLVCLVAVAGTLLPFMVDAHHSFALFDQSKTIAIKGVVSRFDWTNPHVTVYIDVAGSPTQRFKLESGSVNALRRQGWKPDAIKVGNEAEASFHPLKTGAHPGGLLLEIKTGNVVLKGGG